MTASERDLVHQMYDAMCNLIELAHSIQRYGPAFPGTPEDDMAVKNARELLAKADIYLGRSQPARRSRGLRG